MSERSQPRWCCAPTKLNVSAFTARCIASADARLEHVILGALCAFQGRRHGGMGARVEAMLDDASRAGIDRTLERVLSEQGEVPGFGHPLYPGGDPRATATDLFGQLALFKGKVCVGTWLFGQRLPIVTAGHQIFASRQCSVEVIGEHVNAQRRDRKSVV